VTDGCYIGDVTLGAHPEEVVWVLCGAIGQAGMEAIFQMSNGQCTLMASLAECELAQLRPLFMRIIYTIYGGVMLVILSCAVCIAFFCCRRKPASVRREQGNMNTIPRGVAVGRNYFVQGATISPMQPLIPTGVRVGGTADGDVECIDLSPAGGFRPQDEGGIRADNTRTVRTTPQQKFNGDYNSLPSDMNDSEHG
jgi:hypothetical protein